MSNVPPRFGRGELDSPLALEAGELTLSNAPQSVPVGMAAADSSPSIDPVDVDFTEIAPSGPAVALRLTVPLQAGIDAAACRQEVLDLFHCLDEVDRALGGAGLTMDASGGEAGSGMLALLLWPLDARRSLHRFSRMAEMLTDGILPGPSAQPEAEKNGPPEEASRSTELETSRGKICRWRHKHKWSGDFNIEIIRFRRGNR